MAKVMLASGLVVAYGYLMEAFIAWYSGNPYERVMMLNRALGTYGWCYWLLIASQYCDSAIALVSLVRGRMWRCCLRMALVINVGMWLERFVIVVVSLSRDFCRRRGVCTSRRSGIGRRLLGTIGLFAALLFLFIRLLPMISIFEMRELVEESQGGANMMATQALYGLLAEFADPKRWCSAAEQTRARRVSPLRRLFADAGRRSGRGDRVYPHADAVGRLARRNLIGGVGRLCACSTGWRRSPIR